MLSTIYYRTRTKTYLGTCDEMQVISNKSDFFSANSTMFWKTRLPDL